MIIYKQLFFSEKKMIYKNQESPKDSINTIIEKKNQTPEKADIDQQITVCANKLRNYTTTPDKCQALINACYYVAKNNEYCKNNPPWNDGWYIGKYITKLLKFSLSLLVSTAHAETSRKIYQPGETVGAEGNTQK